MFHIPKLYQKQIEVIPYEASDHDRACDFAELLFPQECTEEQNDCRTERYERIDEVAFDGERERIEERRHARNEEDIEDVAADDVTDRNIRLPFRRRNDGGDELGERRTERDNGEPDDAFGDAEFIRNVLRALDEEEIVMSFGGAISPFILQNREDKHSLYLILPVRSAN